MNITHDDLGYGDKPIIPNRRIKQAVSEILDNLCDRSGFDDWWYNLDDDIEKEIEDMMFEVIKRRTNGK